jgi:membrane protein required for colicin V production
MILDIILAILIVFAIIKGFQRGLIVGIFSFLAIIIGLAAAIKLSTVVARYVGRAVNVSDEWLPIISFVVVFIVVILLIRWGANALESVAEVAMLGWLNKLGGILLYAAIYILVFSVVLFYANQIGFIKPETIQKSATWPLVHPWGPKVIDGLGSVIPFFADMFNELKEFFGGVSEKVSPAPAP